MSKGWIKQLYSNKGKIWGSDGQWITPNQEILSKYNGDIWCDKQTLLTLPEYEQNLARFFESVAYAGFSNHSGSAKFNFVFQHITHRATGDLFDWNAIFIDRIASSNDEFYEQFGKAPRRTFNRLKSRIDNKRSYLLHGSLTQRMALMDIARKCFLARIGYAEYCSEAKPE